MTEVQSRTKFMDQTDTKKKREQNMVLRLLTRLDIFN